MRLCFAGVRLELKLAGHSVPRYRQEGAMLENQVLPRRLDRMVFSQAGRLQIASCMAGWRARGD
jgi:hypothetical protein